MSRRLDISSMSIDVFIAELEFREFKIYELEKKLARAKRCNKLRRFTFIKRLKTIKVMNEKVQKKLDLEIYKLVCFRLFRLARLARRNNLKQINLLREEAESDYPVLKRLF